MNKLTKGLLALSLSAAIIGAGACGCSDSEAWEGTTFTDYGAVIEQSLGGFVAETDKYVYFINGVGDTSSDNSFGTPIKGTLVAADKNDISNTQIVIPEMFTASDYGAGLYFFTESDGVYAYYGTPNTEKNSSGETATSEMTFTKTRLDGTNSQKLFTVSSHSVEYRMAQAADGTVYVVYYDSDETALISYNCSTKTSTTIIKTDEEINDKTGEEYLSLDSYYFLDNGCGAQVIYTVTVYTQEYYEQQKTENSSYSRQTAAYNYVYKYSVGSGASVLLNDKDAQAKYAVKSVTGGYLFYTVTPISGKEATYALKTSDLNTATKIDYPDNIKDGMIIKTLTEIYYLDSDTNKVIKNTLVNEGTVTEFNTKQTILKEGVSTLIDVDDKYVYGFDGDGYIVAVERAGDKTIRISERTASTDWYSPEKVMIGDTEYMLYCDSSAIGNSYVYYADLSKLGAPESKDTDDDGEKDLFYLVSAFNGKKPASDKAAEVVAMFDEINSPLEAVKSGDVFTDESVTKARAAYDNLNEKAKENVSEEDLTKLTNAEKALDLWAAFDKLANVRNYLNLTEDEKTALKNNYAAAKALAESYGDDFTKIRGYLSNNVNYFYQETAAKLDPSAT